MNAEIELKLKDLWRESERCGDLTTHAVAHLLLAAHAEGTQDDFARWCAKFYSGVKLETSIDGGQGMLPDEPKTDWVC